MKKKQTWIYLLILLCLLPLSAMAETWSIDNLPMVHLQDANRYVCDPEDKLSQTVRDSADIYLQRLDKECGIESVVALVGSVEDGDAFRLCQDIFDKYGVGDKKTRRGIVIVIATTDRKYFIEPGYGLEQDLTDVECDDIGRQCIAANMRKADTDQAVLTTVKAIYNKFKTGKTGLKDEGDGELSWEAVFIIIAVIWIIAILFSRNNRGGGRSSGSGSGYYWIPLNDSDFGGFSGGGSFGGGGAGGGGAGGGW